MEQKFYVCKHCGNIYAAVKESGVKVKCCGEDMTLIVPGTVDASKEKHIPVYKKEGNKVTVTVGSVIHPMEEAHYIEWISIQTKQGNQRKELNPGQEPVACFCL